MDCHLDDAIAPPERTQVGEAGPAEPACKGRGARDESLHAVIANRARSHSPGELWTSALGGGINALLLWTQFSSLHWLAAGFAGVAAYGAWGLLDRAICNLELKLYQERPSTALLRFSRAAVGTAGWLAAIAALAGFMGAGLGGWNH